MKRAKRIIIGHAKYFGISVLIYAGAMFLGIIISQNTRLSINPTQMYFTDTLLHNGLIGLGMLILGIITFGIFNTFFLAYNAFYLGVTVIGVYNSYGIAPLLSGVLPHAITEIMAILISCTLGYESLRFVKIVKKNATAEIKEKIYISDILILMGVAFILYTVSAIIETNVARVNI